MLGYFAFCELRGEGRRKGDCGVRELGQAAIWFLGARCGGCGNSLKTGELPLVFGRTRVFFGIILSRFWLFSTTSGVRFFVFTLFGRFVARFFVVSEDSPDDTLSCAQGFGGSGWEGG